MQQLRTHNLKEPGVHLQEIILAPTPELLTGVPAFLGIAQVKNAGGTDIPQPKSLMLWTQFNQHFDKPSGYLAHTVRGFFENGGCLCYVVALGENTLEELQRGLKAIEAIDTIDLVCAPDIVRNSQEDAIAMQKAVLEHCDKRGDRFAILDAFDAFNVRDIQVIKNQRQQLQGNNGALYAPWLKVENVEDYIPPCGHIAGIYARTDREFGVHHACANSPLEGVLNLRLTLSDIDGINCIRSFRGRGIRVWGTRTLSQITEWQYVNVRRLFLTVSRWAERNLADVVFEPNDFQLWVRLERELTVYCESLRQNGALQGDTPEEAFYVKCDEETNPLEIRDTGQVVAQMGLAPISPNEFIVVSLVHGSSGVMLT